MQQNIEDFFEDKARAGDGQFAVAYALMQLAREQKSAAVALKHLGLGDAASPLGAMEMLAVEVRDGFREVGHALNALADATEGAD